MIAKDTLQSYFDKARRFDQDRLLQADRSKKLAYGIAALATICAIASSLAVAMLSPLKSVEPFVIRVDNSTGIVDVVGALANAPGTYADEVTKFFSAKYVRGREGYIWSEAEENFKVVSLLSNQSEQDHFAAFYRGKNPDSPQNIYGRAASVKIDVKAISLLNKNLVSVRFVKTITRQQEEPRASHWIATITFSYVNAPMSTTDRLTNPLGFIVSDYRIDPEVL